jgi:hypothetical protein
MGVNEDGTLMTPNDIYGMGFEEGDEDVRREMILRKRERDLQEEYGPYFEPDPESDFRTVGQLTSAVADPTSLLPLGRGVLTAFGIGSGLGVSTSVAEDLATTGEIDPVKAAIYGGTGGALGAAFPLAGKAYRAIRDSAGRRVADDAVAKAEMNLDASVDNQIANDSAFSRLMGRNAQALDRYLGTLSTRIGNISEPIMHKVREFEFNVHTNTQKALADADPFLRSLKQMKGGLKREISRHLFDGNYKAAEGLMTKPMREQFSVVKDQLANYRTRMQESGLPVMDEAADYFPRRVKDYEGLRQAMGKPLLGKIDKAEKQYAEKLGKRVTDLDQATRAEIANKVIRGYELKTDGNLPSFAKPRQFEKIPENLRKFYSSPEESLHLYLRNAENTLARRKFFGRNLVIEGAEENKEASIGNVVAEEIAAGRISSLDQDKLVELLSSRFIKGEQSMGAGFGTIRDLGYAGTIANFWSALTQFGDLGTSGALNGFRNTIKSMLGSKDITIVDLGINNISQEFSDVRKTSKLLDKAFGVSGFKAIDRLGKETFINASFRKNIKMVQSKAGEAAFRKKWGKFYGDDIETLITDLKAGKVTDTTKFHAFNELSGVQPITMSEMPQAYLDNPNFGRLLYSLKSFTIKQIDVVRREIVQEFRKGSKISAVKKAATLAGYLAAANVGTQTVKDLLLGRDVYVEDLPDNAVWALLSVFGVNKYTSDKYLSKGEWTDAFWETIKAATPIIDAVTTGAYELTKEDPDLSKQARSIPVIGPLLYNWFLGGAEKYNERLAKER